MDLRVNIKKFLKDTTLDKYIDNTDEFFVKFARYYIHAKEYHNDINYIIDKMQSWKNYWVDKKEDINKSMRISYDSDYNHHKKTEVESQIRE